MTPLLSIVIPVHDQAPRLRLTLAALEAQLGSPRARVEVIIVDDDSRDEVVSVIAAQAARGAYPITVVHCRSGGARGVPRNLGLARACGGVVLFLDADALPGRSLVARHLAAHDGRGRLVLGEMLVLRDTEHLLDPADGTPFPGATPLDPLIVPVDEVRAGIPDELLLARAEPGIYPDQAAWHAQLEEAVELADPLIAGVAAIPHNLSLDRVAIEQLGGFDPALPHLEGWDLGLRAAAAGLALGLARGARSFHLYHRRDGGTMVANLDRARAILRERFPAVPLDALALWIPACFGDRTIPSELGVHHWRSLSRLLADPAGRAECERLLRLRAALVAPVPALEYRLRSALNAGP